MAKYFLGIAESEGAYEPDGVADLDAVMQAHREFTAEVEAAGASIVAGEALMPTSTASYLRGTRSADLRSVDNPLPEVKEVFGGFYVIDAPDEATALRLAGRCPAPYGYIEMRPVWSFD